MPPKRKASLSPEHLAKLTSDFPRSPVAASSSVCGAAASSAPSSAGAPTSTKKPPLSGYVVYYYGNFDRGHPAMMKNLANAGAKIDHSIKWLVICGKSGYYPDKDPESLGPIRDARSRGIPIWREKDLDNIDALAATLAPPKPVPGDHTCEECGVHIEKPFVGDRSDGDFVACDKCAFICGCGWQTRFKKAASCHKCNVGPYCVACWEDPSAWGCNCDNPPEFEEPDQYPMPPAKDKLS